MGDKYCHLTKVKRIKIEALFEEGYNCTQIAKAVNVSISTISRELKRGRYMKTLTSLEEKVSYSFDKAHNQYRKNLCKKGKGLNLKDKEDYLKYLENQIKKTKVSPYVALHNAEKKYGYKIFCLRTFYNYLDIKDEDKRIFKGITLADCPMPSKIRNRKVIDCNKQKKYVSGKTIEDRPKEIDLKNIFGHWEFDTVVGDVYSKESLLVGTERKHHIEIIEVLREHTSNAVVSVFNKIERKLGTKLFRTIFKSITTDNGGEFANWEGIEKSNSNKRPRTEHYYCHSYCYFERGLNENQNKFIRRFCPKGESFDGISKKKTKFIEAWMNNYTRLSLGELSPFDSLEQDLRNSKEYDDKTINDIMDALLFKI